MKTVACIITGVLAASGAAHAGFVNATFTGVSPGQQVTISNGITTYAGIYNFTYTGGTSPELGQTFAGFCIEITEAIGNNQSHTWTTSSLQSANTSFVGGMGGARADRIRELFGRRFDSAVSGNSSAAAFQLAVWELVYDDSLDLASGSFHVVNAPSDTLALAASYLDEIDGSGPKFRVFSLMKPGTQDYAVVPTPGSAALACLGLIAMRRRR